MDSTNNAGTSSDLAKSATPAESTSNNHPGCGCNSSTITVCVTPTTGGQFDLQVGKSESVENLKKLISKKLKVPKERICLLHRERQLRDGTLQENNLLDGSRLTLLPSVETGLLAQRPEQSVMQALESLNDSQVNDFLSGKAPLNLTMRLGDHMMLIQLQLSTVTPTSSTRRSTSTVSSSIPSTVSTSTDSSTTTNTTSSSGVTHKLSPVPPQTERSSHSPLGPLLLSTRHPSLSSVMNSPDRNTKQTSSTASHLPHVSHHHHHHQRVKQAAQNNASIHPLPLSPQVIITPPSMMPPLPPGPPPRKPPPPQEAEPQTSVFTNESLKISEPLVSPVSEVSSTSTQTSHVQTAQTMTGCTTTSTTTVSSPTSSISSVRTSQTSTSTITSTPSTLPPSQPPAEAAQSSLPLTPTTSPVSSSTSTAPVISERTPSSPGGSSSCKCEQQTVKPTLDTRALAEASRNLTQTLKQLSSEVLTSRSDPAEEAGRARRQGAIIESMHHHGKGVYSGTFSGTLNPALQDRFGRPKRDISTIIHILNDLLCATPQYRRHRQGSSIDSTGGSPAKQNSQTLGQNGTDQSDESSLSRENQATRGKLEHLRLIMEERRAKRRARREARSAPYMTQWSAKSESVQQGPSGALSHEPMDTTEAEQQQQQLCEVNPPEPVVA